MKLYIVILLQLVIIAGASPSVAQALFRLSPGVGRAGVTFSGAWRGDGGRPATANTNFNEYISIPFSGELIDARILNYSLILRPVFWQRGSSSLPSSIDSRSLDASLSTRMLSGLPLNLTVDWRRTAGSSAGGFGTKSDSNSSSVTAAASYRSGLLPVSLSVARRRVEDFSFVGVGLVPLELSHETKTVRFSARNRKISIQAGRVEFDDHVRNGDFSTHDFRFSQRFRWGKGSTLRSSYDIIDRNGNTARAHRRSVWREALHLKHSRGTETDFLYERSQSNDGGSDLGSRGLSGRIDSRVTEWLGLGMNASGRSASFVNGSQTTYSVLPSARLRAALPLDARVDGRVSVGYQRRHKQGDVGVVHIIDRRMEANPTGSIVISQAGVDTASIVVRSADGTVTFQNGLDYRVVGGGSFVEVRSLPGGRIGPGDNVLLSYRFTPNFDGREESLLTRYSLSLRLAGFRLTHGRSRRSSEIAAGDLLQGSGDFEETEVGISSFHQTLIGALRTELTRRRRASETLNYVMYEIRSGLVFPARKGLSTQLNLAGQRTRESGRDVRSFNIRPSFTHALTRKLNLRGAGSYWFWEDRGGRKEVSFGGDLNLGWRLGSTDVTFGYAYERRRLEHLVVSNRLNVSIVRRF